MIVRNLKDAEATPRRVATDNWESTRLLLKDDAMGFSFHITTVYAGTENRFWYKHHLESVYCISGTGSIEDLATGEVHRIEPGVVYALDRHDRHVLRADADADLVFACVFNPPVSGREVHDADGAYLPDGEPLPTDPSDDRAGEEHAA